MVENNGQAIPQGSESMSQQTDNKSALSHLPPPKLVGGYPRTLGDLAAGAENTTPHEVKTNSFPELIANAPLEHTSLVYSVPFKGEWYNGNLQRLLLTMLSQKQAADEAFEVELIANIGGESLKGGSEAVVREADESVDYLKKIVNVQRLARILLAQPGNQTVRQEMDQLITSVADPLLQQVAKLAIEKANNISIALIDGTHTDFYADNQYDYRLGYNSLSTMASRRTFGTDVAYARFASHPETVISMWDADTVLEDTTSVSRMQRIFRTHPDLHYIFSRLSYLPAGQPEGLVADSPRHNADQSARYNDGFAHGSPQIAFRLGAYETLEEIMEGIEEGFPGDEDRTLSYRLIYHYGKMQDGLLLHGDSDFYPATVLTGDRLDGLVDSRSRADSFAHKGVHPMAEGLGKTFSLREEMFARIDSLPSGKKEEALTVLQEARHYYERQQRMQQRFNRSILTTFLQSLDNGVIQQDNGKVADEHALLSTRAGTHLLLYMRTNPDLVKQVLLNPNNLKAIRYFSSNSSSLPEGDLTPFQLAIREYVGETVPFDEVVNSGQAEVRKTQWEYYPGKFMDQWGAEDFRERESKVSLMHSAIAEILALGYTYNVLFETDEFLESRKGWRTWPEDPKQQRATLDRGPNPLGPRIDYLKSKMDVRGSEIGN